MLALSLASLALSIVHTAALPSRGQKARCFSHRCLAMLRHGVTLEQRWHKLYKRLRTQSKAYTWGNNEKGCLGHAAAQPPTGFRGTAGHVLARHGRRQGRKAGYPREMQGLDNLGVISDMQCGGWSTTTIFDRELVEHGSRAEYAYAQAG